MAEWKYRKDGVECEPRTFKHALGLPFHGESLPCTVTFLHSTNGAI